MIGLSKTISVFCVIIALVILPFYAPKTTNAKSTANSSSFNESFQKNLFKNKQTGEMMFLGDQEYESIKELPKNKGYYYIKPKSNTVPKKSKYVDIHVYAPSDSLVGNSAFISIRDSEDSSYLGSQPFDEYGYWRVDIGDYELGDSDIIVQVMSGSGNRIYSMAKGFQKKNKTLEPSMPFYCDDSDMIISNSQEIANELLSEGVSGIIKQSDGLFYSTEVGGSIGFAGTQFDDYFIDTTNSLYSDYRLSFLETYTRWLDDDGNKGVFNSVIDFESPFDNLDATIYIEDINHALVNYNNIVQPIDESNSFFGASLYLKDPGMGSLMLLNRGFDNIDHFYYSKNYEFAVSAVGVFVFDEFHIRMNLMGRGDLEDEEDVIEIFKDRFKPRVLNARAYAEKGYYGNRIDLNDERTNGMLFGVWVDNFGTFYQAGFPEDAGSMSLFAPDGEEFSARNSSWYLNCLDYPDFPLEETFPCDQYGMYSINWTLNNNYTISSAQLSGDISFDGVNWGKFRRSLIGGVVQRLQSMITKKIR